ncbi:TonB-dependent receptor, partial [candidate division WOR-3 bacterium]|nr:TonB-dependent receptor [candidate division WOR-3 bacterium]
ARDSGWYDPEKRRWSDGWSEEKAWMWYYEKIANYGYWNTNTGEWQWTGEDSLQKLWHAIKALNNRYYETNEWMFTEDSSNIYYHKFDLDKYIEDIKRYYNDSTFTADSIELSGNMYYIRYNYDEFHRFNYNFLPFWYDEENSNRFIDFSLKSKIGIYNLIKVGGLLKEYNMNSTDVEFINTIPYLYLYEARPIAMAVYLSDKVNYRKFTINAGIRFDYFNPGVDYVNSKYNISPRIGVSFILTPSSVIYCNWGKFVQLSGVDYKYSNVNINLFEDEEAINPDIPWEETSIYALGTKWKMLYGLQLNTSLYWKDVRNILSDTSNIATINGVDLSIDGLCFKYLYWVFRYSYLNSREYMDKDWWPLEWDITHSLALNLNLSLPPDFGPELGSFKPLANLNTTLRFIYTSAFPFDRRDFHGSFVGVERSYDNLCTDLRLEKDFQIAGVKLGLFVEIWNLFDRENIINVYSYTGKPDDDGNPPRWDPVRYESMHENDPYINRKYESAYDVYLSDYENWKEYCNKPDHYDIPQIVRFGVTTSF